MSVVVRMKDAARGSVRGSAAPAALHADKLTVQYRSSRGPVTALEDLTLALGQGEFLSVLGPSGCGKSTLLKLAAGLLKPLSGEMRLKDERITGPNPDVGVVFQQPTLLPWLTILENTLVPVRNLRGDVVAGRRRALDLLDLLEIGGFKDHYPHELSGGMQQRAGIARGLINSPSVLLMDEPFAALDAMTREMMMIELQRIWSSTACSILFITHSIPEAVFLSDRIVVLTERPGRVLREVDVDLPRPRSIETMASSPFGHLCTELRSMFKKRSAT
jgi:NitT/TauT family transport system ATP-binding protein